MSLISADFADVDAGASALLAKANEVGDNLRDFHKSVVSFMEENWGNGQSSDAFTQMQTQWNTDIQDLNATLAVVAQFVRTGNSDLQAQDAALAKNFI